MKLAEGCQFAGGTMTTPRCSVTNAFSKWTKESHGQQLLGGEDRVRRGPG